MSNNLDAILDQLAKLQAELNEQKAEIDRLSKINSQLGDANQEFARRLQEKESELAAKNRQYDETVAVMKELVHRLKKITRPPSSFATFLKFVDKEQDIADVMMGQNRKRVPVDPNLNKEDIQFGMTVVISDENGAIVGTLGEPESVGQVMKLERYLDQDTAIVADERGEQTTARVSIWANTSDAMPGSKVMVAGGFIWGVVEKADEQVAMATNRYLMAEVPDVDFDSIGGLDKELALIRTEIEDAFEVPELYEAYRIPRESHTLLYGLPGNGKTMIAKAIAKTQFDRYKDKILAHAPGNFFAVRGPELESKWIGESEKSLREVFDAATTLAQKSSAPVFIFFDDCESFLLRRGSGISSDVNMGHVTQFATLLEGVKSIRGVNVILATNRIDLIDPAIIRRMNVKLRVPEPDRAAATSIFKKQLAGVPLNAKHIQERPDLEEDWNGLCDYIVGIVIERLYRDSRENDFMEIIFDDESSEKVKISQMVSGKIISDIVNRAKKNAKDRDKVSVGDIVVSGISVDDLLTALETEFRNNEGLPNTKEMVSEWLKQKGKNRSVVQIRKLFGEQAGERRVRHHIQ